MHGFLPDCYSYSVRLTAVLLSDCLVLTSQTNRSVNLIYNRENHLHMLLQSYHVGGIHSRHGHIYGIRGSIPWHLLARVRVGLGSASRGVRFDCEPARVRLCRGFSSCLRGCCAALETCRKPSSGLKLAGVLGWDHGLGILPTYTISAIS